MRAPTGVRLPRRTIRLRLALLFGTLFLVSGAALLAVTYLLVDHQFTANGASFFIASGSQRSVSVRGGASGGVSISLRRSHALPAPGLLNPAGPPTSGQLEGVARRQSSAALNQLLIDSGIALGIMAVISIWLGWLVSGRVLQPLRTITTAARDISANSLHRRLALGGPDDELKQLGSTFDDLLSRLETSFDAQRQFVANASHELRTPLTLERTLVEVALADTNPTIESLRHTCQQVLAAGEHHERLIEALLTLSRSQRGLDSQRPIDLTTTTAATIQSLDHRGITLTTQLEPAWTTGDQPLVERLVGNLLANAARHNTPHGRIDVQTHTRSGRAVLSVSNTGPVVPPGDLERLFEPFQRLDNERTGGTDGFGLGLSIIQAIATAHAATLAAHPRPHGGLHIEVGFLAATPPTRHDSSPGTRP